MIERGGRVTKVIKERIESGSQPGYRQDNFKVGAVIEGGCMRGAVSGGETLGLCALGLLPAFDAVYGVSAGAAAGSFLLAQQADSVSIYFENVNNERFFDPRRALRGQPVVDIFYLTHKVMKEIRPLDWKRVIDSPTSLHIFVTSATDAKSVDLTNFSSQEELLSAIHCSCRMPIITGKPLRVADNTYYTDGGVSTGGGLALEEAIADGCTHLLILQSKPDQPAYRAQPGAMEFLAYFLLKSEYPALARAILKINGRYARNCEKIKSAEAHPDLYPQAIEGVRVPAGTPEVAMFETNKRRLVAGAQAGKRALFSKFGATGGKVHRPQ